MNPRRDKPGEWVFRRGHCDEIGEEKLTETMLMLKRVAHGTGTTLNQVIGVFDAASRNRMTEVLLDSGDVVDSVVRELEQWGRTNGCLYVKISGDDGDEEVRVKVVDK